MLKNEINDLKGKTDVTIDESQNALTNIEKLQCSRKTAIEFFQPVGSVINGAGVSLENSHLDKSRMLSPAIILKEPNTSLTKNTTFSYNTQAVTSVIQHNRHQS
jgi:hypothetical protein